MTFNSVKMVKWAAPAVSMLLPLLAGAQATAPVNTTPLAAVPKANVNTVSDVFNALCNILGWIFILFVIIAVLFVIIAAFKYLTAGGDAEKVQGVNHALIYAVVAIVVAVLAKAIPLIVGNFFGVTGFTQC